MAEVTDLLPLSPESADVGGGEDLHPETLDPAPLRPSRLRRAAVILASGLSPDLPHSGPSPSPWIPADIFGSGHDSDPGPEFWEDQLVSLALDLFDPCPLHHQDSESPHFSVLEVADEMSPDDPGLSLGLVSRPAFEIQEVGGGGDGDRVGDSDWGGGEFFFGQRRSVSESIEFSRSDGHRISGFESDSDSGEQIAAISAVSDSSGAPVLIGDDTGLPLCWDCFPIEDDRRDTVEEFEWEEVEEADGHFEECEVLSMMVVSEEEAAGVLSEMRREHEEDAARSIEWEVLLTVNNLGRNPMDPEDVESYFVDDLEGFVYTSEYEVLVGQFPDHYSSLKGTPPAAKSVVENLPSVVLTKEDIGDNNTDCAVCKDEIPIKEWAKKLPCSHHYHKECILPWLRIRNTCPLCRFELPTDDPEYEKWKARRAGNGVSEEDARVRYDFEILPEA